MNCQIDITPKRQKKVPCKLNNKKLIVIHNHICWLHLTENWIYQQVRYLPEDVEKHIVCKSTLNLDQFALPNIHCLAETSVRRYIRIIAYGLRKLKLRFRRQAALLLWVAKHTKASILHSHFGYTGWRYMEAAKKAGLKHVVTFYGVDASRLPHENPVWLKRYHQMFSMVDCVLCEGPYLAASVIKLGCPEHKIRVHHLGVRVDEIPFRPRQWKPNGPLRILIAASFREKKGIPYALEALGQLQKNVSIEITIVGDAGQNPETQAEKCKILSTIEKHNLRSKVRLLGYQPFPVMLEEAYHHHIFLSPSVAACNGDTEGGAPVSIIEMAASGMPVVSTKHCDIPEIIQDRTTGLLAKERDVDGLVKNLLWLVRQPEKWRPLTEAARRHIEAQFNAQTQGEKLAQIYTEILKS